MWKRLWVLIVGVCACSDATAPRQLAIPDAVPLTDLSTVRSQWRNMKECSGITNPALDVSDITFFSVPRESFNYGDDSAAADGLFVPAWRQVYVAKFNDDSLYSAHVMRALLHEIMHALLWPMPSGDHPKQWFEDTRCGNLMDDLKFQTGPHI